MPVKTYSSSLEEKITHARALDASYKGATVKTIPELLEKRKNKREKYLIYIDQEDQRVTLTYQKFDSLVRGVAGHLLKSGLKKGDKIATIAHNHWQTVVIYFAAWLIGLVIVPINLDEDNRRIGFILEDADVKLAFIHEDYVERIEGIKKKQKAIKSLATATYGNSLDSYLTNNKSMKLPKIDGESDALLVYTSGTTGKPKGVLLTQRNLLEDAHAISWWHLITEDTRMMCVLPIHHVNGTVVTLITPFYAGGSTVLNEKFRVKRFFSTIKDEYVQVVSVVPTMLQFLTNAYTRDDLPGMAELRHIICGGGPLTIKAVSDFEEMFGIPVIHGYGLSETTCYSCFTPVELLPDDHKSWMRDHGYPSIGAPLPVNEMDIHNDQGNPVIEGERGEIVIRGVNVMKEYYCNPEANEESFANGWFRSGDEGFYLTDKKKRKYFFITGRLKEIILRGGVSLAPLEIDEIINNVPGVEAGIAVGFENEWYGEEVGAYVKMKPGVKQDSEKILSFCEEYLPFSKCPKVVVFGDEMPVTSSGKYQRKKLTSLFKTWKSTQFRKMK